MKTEKSGLNKLIFLLNKWKVNLIVALILFVFPITAIYVRGQEAITGITWGYKNTINSLIQELKLCEINLFYRSPYCQSVKDQSRHLVNFGIYDPNLGFKDSKKIAIEHYFIQWNSFQKGDLLSDLESAQENNRWSLITVEPFTWDDDELSRQNLFSDIVNGKFDQAIINIGYDIKVYGQSVLVRWGHEMENVTGRYPWAQSDSKGYIESYRYFVNKLRSITGAGQVFFVWSPVGNHGLDQYWPGREYADCVGLSVFSFPEWEKDYYGKVRTFEENFSEKYNRVEKYNRPVMIAELGATGEKDDQKLWLEKALMAFREFPLLKSIVYFNSVDSPKAWGLNYPIPDWTINASLFPGE